MELPCTEEPVGGGSLAFRQIKTTTDGREEDEQKFGEKERRVPEKCDANQMAFSATNFA